MIFAPISQRILCCVLSFYTLGCTSTFNSPPPFASIDKKISPEGYGICHEKAGRNILKTIPGALRDLPFLSEDILKVILQKGLNFFSRKVWARIHTLPPKGKNQDSEGSFVAFSQFRIPLNIPTEFKSGKRKGSRVLFNQLKFGAVPGKSQEQRDRVSIEIKDLKLGQFHMTMPQADSGEEEVILEEGYRLDLKKNTIKLDGKVYVSQGKSLKLAFCKLQIENNIQLAGRACTGLNSFLCDWQRSNIKYRIEKSLLKGLNSDESQKQVKKLFL